MFEPCWFPRAGTGPLRVAQHPAAVVADPPGFLRLSGSFGVSTFGRKVIQLGLLGARAGAAMKR